MFELRGELTNVTDVPLALLGLSYSVRTSDLIAVQRDTACPVSSFPVRIPTREPVELCLPIEFNRDVLDAIEAKRTGEVTLQISANAIVALTYPRQEGSRTVTYTGETIRIALTIRGSETGQNTYKISRDAWHVCLNAFKYSEVDVIEVPVAALSKMLPTEALAQLAAAERAYRDGDWSGTLAKARLAFEAVAKVTGQTNNIKQGFSTLWSSLLPNAADEPRRDALNESVGGLSTFLHLGRHVSYPVIEVTREMALHGLRCAVSTFALMGALADKKPKSS